MLAILSVKLDVNAGALISLYAISLAQGNALTWIWVVAFVIFGAWQALVLWRPATR